MKAKYLSKTSQQFIYVAHVIYFQVLYLIITMLCNYCFTFHFDIYFVNISVYSKVMHGLTLYLIVLLLYSLWINLIVNKPEPEHKYQLPVVLYGCEAWSLTGRRRT